MRGALVWDDNDKPIRGRVWMMNGCMRGALVWDDNDKPIRGRVWMIDGCLRGALVWDDNNPPRSLIPSRVSRGRKACFVVYTVTPA
jgi:hypothetical protein